jgi:hypothetical protein
MTDNRPEPPGKSAAQLRPVLIVAYHFPPENTSGAARPFRFYKYLTEFGYRPYVIAAGQPDSGPAKEGVCYVPNRRLVPCRTTLPGLTEMVLRKFFFPNDEGVSWTLAAVSEARKLIEAHSIRVMLSTAPPFTTALAALQLKRRYGLKWVADFRDPLVGNPFRVQHGLPGMVNRFLESRIFRHADALTAVTDQMTEDWKGQHPGAAGKIRLICNGFDPDETFGPAPIPRREYKVLSHVGAILGGRHPIKILESIQRLVDRELMNPAKFRVRLTGDIEQQVIDLNRNIFTDLKEKGCLEYNDCVVPKIQAMRAIAESDYLLLLDGNSLDLGFAIPAKFFDYVRAGRPILVQTARNSPLDRILPQCGIPSLFVYPNDSEEQADRQILKLFDLPTAPVDPSPWFWSQFDGRRQTEALAGILDDLLGVAPGPKHCTETLLSDGK